MYLVITTRKKHLFTLLESCLDFVLADDCYVHNYPEVFRLNGDSEFDKFMNTTYRGVESVHHQEGKPSQCDVFTFDLWSEKDQRFIPSGWIDDKQNGMNMREVVGQYAIEIEEKQLCEQRPATLYLEAKPSGVLIDLQLKTKEN